MPPSPTAPRNTCDWRRAMANLRLLDIRGNKELLLQVVEYEQAIYPPSFHYPLEGWLRYSLNPSVPMVAMAATADGTVTHFACGCLVNESEYRAFVTGHTTERDFEWYKSPDMTQPLYFYFATIWRRALPYADCLVPHLNQQLAMVPNLRGWFAIASSAAGARFMERQGMVARGMVGGYSLFEKRMGA